MKTILKWFGITSGTILGFIMMVSLAFYGIGQIRINKKYIVPSQTILIPDGPHSLAEGKRIFQYRGCEACHGEHLQGLVYLDNPTIGRVITPNLTSGQGGIGAERTDTDLIRAIKYGVRPDGTPLLFMPSTEFYYLSDNDLGKILVYMRSVPPVDNTMPPSSLSTTGFVAMNITKAITFIPAELIPHDEPPPQPPEPGVMPEYGQYLSLSCFVCHGATLSGGEIPGFPPEWPSAPNLTPGKGSRLPMWGEEGFIEIMQTGKTHGRMLTTGYMPWTSYRHMTADELRAVYLYLISLPPKDFDNH